MKSCAVCRKEIKLHSLEERDVYGVKCPKCGDYIITVEASVNLENTDLSDRQRANISGWLSENHKYEINSQNLDSYLVKISSPSFIEKADKLLSYVANLSEYAGRAIPFQISFISRSYCINETELRAIIEYLGETGRLFTIGGGLDLRTGRYKVGPKGWIRLEELSNKSISSQGFVAMWFADDMKPLYDEAIAPAISDAGYIPHRVDLREHNDKIDDEIISQIRKSRFVVADFTGHRGGVYFEAGFAKGLGQEVFWLCNEDDLESLHFDIRQYNCITWSHSDRKELRKRLALRIESVLGIGPRTE